MQEICSKGSLSVMNPVCTGLNQKDTEVGFSLCDVKYIERSQLHQIIKQESIFMATRYRIGPL